MYIVLVILDKSFNFNCSYIFPFEKLRSHVIHIFSCLVDFLDLWWSEHFLCTFLMEFTSREELTHWKRLWCWEGLGSGGEEDDRGWDGWMASPTRWTWVWVNSGSWWWTGRSGVLQFMGSERVGHNKRLNWTELREFYLFSFSKLL